MLGRVFDGLGNPKDNGPKIVSKEKFDLVGSSINPYSREEPSEFIQTGMSNIDGMNTLGTRSEITNFLSIWSYHTINLHHRLQDRHKFSARKKTFLLSLQQLELQVRRQTFSLNNLKRVVHLERTALFLNLSSDPSMERILTPRLALNHSRVSCI